MLQCAMIYVALNHIRPLGVSAISSACHYLPELHDACLP